MNKEMSLFDFKDKQIRVLTDENGDPWFVAKDVCDILDIRNVSQAVSSLDEYEKTNISTVYIWNEPGKAPVIINESGLYSLIFKSRKQEAKDFKLWVTSEVLPSIRKTGSYSVGQAKAISEEDNKHKLEVLQLAKGLVHPDFLEAKAKIVIAQEFGELPELESGSRPLYVQDYLKSKGLKSKEIKSKSSSFGKRLKALYIAEHGESPKTAPQEVHGRITDVNAYTEKDRKLMDKIFNLMFGDEK